MDDLERQLLHRLLGGFNPPEQQSTVRVGALPDDFPIELPEQTRVLGSLERRFPRVPPGAAGMHQMDSVQVELDSPLSGPQWLDSLRRELADDWRSTAHHGLEQGGFLPADPPDLLSLESPERRQGLYVQAVPTPSGTQLRLTLSDLHEAYFQRFEGFFPRPPTVRLTAPGGTRVIPSGGGGSGTHMAYAARLVTDLPPADLLAHYAPQLQAQGWQEVTRHDTPALAVSVWRRGAGEFTFLTLEMTNGDGLDGSMVVQAPEQAAGAFSSYQRSD